MRFSSCRRRMNCQARAKSSTKFHERFEIRGISGKATRWRPLLSGSLGNSCARIAHIQQEKILAPDRKTVAEDRGAMCRPVLDQAAGGPTCFRPQNADRRQA